MMHKLLSKFRRKHFSNRDVKGCYGFNFHGTVIAAGVETPINAAGLICTDGRGRITSGSRVDHTPLGATDRTAVGTYHVEPTGVGEATFIISTGGVPSTRESFHFVIANNDRTLKFVSRTVTGPNGEDLGIDVNVTGEALKQ